MLTTCHMLICDDQNVVLHASESFCITLYTTVGCSILQYHKKCYVNASMNTNFYPFFYDGTGGREAGRQGESKERERSRLVREREEEGGREGRNESEGDL